jgi:CheY-like chemotaxis protein/prolyl-tRNA editing enzyme YbaK/EbsC (Cys-tRNA(Pro) deacylase)
MSMPCWLKRVLGHYGVAYEVHHHRPVHSASRLAQAEHLTGHRVAKCVFVSAFGRPVTVVLPSSRRLDPESVRAVLGGEPTFASEDEIQEWFPNCFPGAVPPLRLRPDQSILMDRSLAHLGDIEFPACTPTESVRMRFRDWYELVRPGVGHFSQARPSGADLSSRPMILVVEDEAETNHLLCRLLRQAGYACKAATDGGQALRLAAELHPAAVILDLMLPDMSGFDVYERLRQSAPLKSPPSVLIVTALDDADSRERGYRLGADAYLVKPFTPEALMDEISGALADAVACG